MTKDTLKSSPDKNTFLEITLFLFAFTLPMWNSINTLFIYPLILAWIFLNNWREKASLLKKNLFPFLFLLSIYLLFLSNFLFSQDNSQNTKLAVKALPLLLFPLIFFSTPTTYYRKASVFTGLIFGAIVTILICWGRIFLDIMSKKDPIDQATYFFEWIYTDFNLLKPFGAHPSYVGVMIVLLIIILMCYEGFKNFREEKALYRLTLIVLIFFILQTNSRISFLCLLLFLIYFFLRNWNKKSILQLLSLFIILFLLSLKFDYLFNKITSVLSHDGKITFDRWPRWVAIFQENNFWGNKWIGVGKEKAQFIYNEAYFKNGFLQALNENYNAHNQYLDFFVSNGIIGLLVFIIALFYFFIKTYKSILPVCFILIVMIFCINETIFGRSSGLIFFSFFYTFFYINFRNNA